MINYHFPSFLPVVRAQVNTIGQYRTKLIKHCVSASTASLFIVLYKQNGFVAKVQVAFGSPALYKGGGGVAPSFL